MSLIEATTIKIHKDTKSTLDTFREYKSESYDEVIRKVLYIAKTARDEPQLSKEVLDAIDKARARVKKGTIIYAKEAKQRLGL